MAYAAGKIKGIIALFSDGRKEVLRNQRRKSILTEVNASGAEQEAVCANEKEQWPLGYYATFPPLYPWEAVSMGSLTSSAKQASGRLLTSKTQEKLEATTSRKQDMN